MKAARAKVKAVEDIEDGDVMLVLRWKEGAVPEYEFHGKWSRWHVNRITSTSRSGLRFALRERNRRIMVEHQEAVSGIRKLYELLFPMHGKEQDNGRGTDTASDTSTFSDSSGVGAVANA